MWRKAEENCDFKHTSLQSLDTDAQRAKSRAEGNVRENEWLDEVINVRGVGEADSHHSAAILEILTQKNNRQVLNLKKNIFTCYQNMHQRLLIKK